MKKKIIILFIILSIISCEKLGSTSVFYSEEYTFITYNLPGDKKFYVLTYCGHSYITNEKGGFTHLENCSCKK